MPTKGTIEPNLTSRRTRAAGRLRFGSKTIGNDGQLGEGRDGGSTAARRRQYRFVRDADIVPDRIRDKRDTDDAKHEEPEKRGITVVKNYVGEDCTSLDMAGASLTLVKLDDELLSLLNAPTEIAIRTF